MLLIVGLALPAPVAARTDASVREYLGAGRFYQPTLYVNRDDGFWPASFLNVLSLEWDGRYTCRYSGKKKYCGRGGHPLSIRGLMPGRGAKEDHLDYPATDGDIDDQRKSFQQNVSGPGSARVYFFAGYGRRKTRTIASFQYWFFYNFNYVAQNRVFRGYHEGDFEQFSILFRSKRVRVRGWTAWKKVPKYVYFSQHNGGELVKSNSPKLEQKVVRLGGRINGFSTSVFAAKGTHANYKDCGPHLRIGLPSDVSECDRRKLFGFRPGLIPLEPRSWACWRGHVGNLGAPIPVRYADGPKPPLQQQKFFDRTPRSLCSRYGSRSSASTGAGVAASATDATARLFDDCRDWQRAPDQPGSKLVVCDEGILDRFFRSGLGDAGPERLRVTGPGLPGDTDPPAVVDADGPAGTARARIATDRAVSPAIYAADRLRDGTLLEARFPRVALAPGAGARLVRGDSVWAIVDGAGHVLAQRVPRVRRRPVAPGTRTVVRRSGRHAVVSGQTRRPGAQGVRYYVVGARTRRDLRREPTVLGRVYEGPAGRLSGRVATRGRRWLQVVAYRRGAERASAPVRVARR